jgi:nucleotide-binding universal stress UspA family protein
MFKRILVPLDGSRFASKALKYAEEIADKFQAEIVLIQIVKPAVAITAPVTGESIIQSPAVTEAAVQLAMSEDKRNVSIAKQYLSKKTREINAKNITSSYNVVIGDPADSIIQFSRKHKIDLIIMTTHGKSGILRAVMGSVADALVRKSGKPVLVIRNKA